MEDPEKNAVDPTVRPTMESRMFDALERDFQQVYNISLAQIEIRNRRKNERSTIKSAWRSLKKNNKQKEEECFKHV